MFWNGSTAIDGLSGSGKAGRALAADVFIHISAVERAGLSTLAEGQNVTFDIVVNRGKEAAENLKPR